MSSLRLIRGCDGDVQIDASRRLVTKTYLHPNPVTAAANARREVEYARRFNEALVGIRGVACPRIIECDFSVPPRVVMEQCPGTALLDFLSRTSALDDRIPHISGKIRQGLQVYTRLFGEPYYDFCFNNMLFDENSGTLVFLDFVIPQGLPDAGPATPLEASLGWLVGCACYELVRPAFLASPSKEAHLELMRAVIAEFDGQVRIERICARARDALSQMCDGGGSLRRNYYRTIGSFFTNGFLRWLTREAVAR